MIFKYLDNFLESDKLSCFEKICRRVQKNGAEYLTIGKFELRLPSKKF